MRRTIFVLLLVTILLLFFLRSDSGVRLHMDQWVSVFPEIFGLGVGDSVHYKGFIIGKVSDISPFGGRYKVTMDTLTASVLPERVAFEIVPGNHPYIDMKQLAQEKTPEAKEEYANKLDSLLKQINNLNLDEKLKQIAPLADTVASLEGTNKGIKEFRQSLKDIQANKDELKKLKKHLEELRENLEDTRSKLNP